MNDTGWASSFRARGARRMATFILIASWSAGCESSPLPPQEPPELHRVTVPMAVEGHAPILTLAFKRPDGGSRTARFLYDSGGGAIILNHELAEEIGLRAEGPVLSDQGESYREVNVPPAWVGGMPVDLRGSKAFMHMGTASFMNRDRVDGMLPGKVFEHYQVVLDYPRQELSLGEPGTLPHRGERLAAPYMASSGHPRVEVRIGDKTFGFLLDTGTQLTLVRDDLLQKWSRDYPNWPRSRGAVGPANVDGAADDALLLRIPIVWLGRFGVVQVAAVSRPNQIYDATKFETPAAIVGAVGGNVLSQFRVEIDYPDGLLFLEPSGRPRENDFQTVGLVLGTNAAGELVVRAVSPSAAPVTRRIILPGDVILQIGSVRGAPYTLTEAGQALSGAVGERKQLRLRRNGERLVVEAAVVRIL